MLFPGATHPEVATSYNNLAVYYRAVEKYTEALPLFSRATKIRELALGEEHPSTIGTRMNLGEVHKTLGQFKEAIPIYERVKHTTTAQPCKAVKERESESASQ